MRKKLLPGLLLALLGWIGSAQAVLIDNGDGTITDTSAGLMWLKDSTSFQSVSWDSAKTWADSLDFAGYSDWRLASATNSAGVACSGYDCSDTEFGSLFYGALGNTAGSLTNTGDFIVDTSVTWFWTAESSGVTCVFSSCVELPYFFDFGTGNQTSGAWETNPLNAWAVRTITATVPESSSLALIVAGLIFLVSFRSKRIL